MKIFKDQLHYICVRLSQKSNSIKIAQHKYNGFVGFVLHSVLIDSSNWIEFSRKKYIN